MVLALILVNEYDVGSAI